MGQQRRSREFALQVLFQREFSKESSPRELVTASAQAFSVEKEIGQAGSQLVLGILDHLEDIDSKINSTSNNWKTARMALVDLNLLRIACYEMLILDPPTPFKVCIDEAVELAKKYGTTESAAFLNGILDQLAKSNFS